MYDSKQQTSWLEQAPPADADTGQHTARSHSHFETLDGLRGVAAFAVVCLHMRDLIGGYLTPSSAYLAVDFFFCLSGFVICHAYQRRLQSDLGLRDFAALRIARLAPLYLLGMGLGLMTAVLAVMMGKGEVRESAVDSLVGIVGFLGLPAPSYGVSHALFPLNVPAWSLFFEIIANGFFAVFLKYGFRNRLGIYFGLAAIALIGSAFFLGSLDGGNDWRTALVGLARVAWGFPAGCLVYALWKRRLLSDWSGGSWAVYPLLGFLLFVDLPPEFRALFDGSMALLICPLLILWAAYRQPAGMVGRIEREIGAMSYAIYIVHVPLGFLYAALIARLFGVPASDLAPLGGLLFLPLLLVFAWLADRYFDAPVRGYFKAKLIGSKGR